MKKPREINWDNVEFQGDKRYLSNMYPAEIYMDPSLSQMFPMFTFDNYIYTASENLYQALKSNLFQHRKLFAEVGAKYSKNLGKKLEIRSDWEDVKIEAMRLCLMLKFDQHPDLAEKLIATRDEYLEERNDWNDTYWGTYLGEGENHLGKLLMEIRTLLQNIEKEDNE